MKSGFLKRLAFVLTFLASVAVLSGGLWRYAHLQALDQLALQGQADLALASDRLVGQLQRYRQMAVLLADHPVVEALAAGGDVQAATDLFLAAADKTAALDVMFLDTAGRLMAAAHAPPGLDLGATPYVKRAGHGALGWAHGSSTPLEGRAFYYAAPSFAADGKVRGSLVVAADLSAIEDAWRGGLRAVFFTDPAGRVIVSNRSELVDWTRLPGAPGLEPPAGQAPPFDSYETGGHEVWQLGWGPYLPRNALHLTQALPVIGLTGEVLMDVAPARRLALLQAAALAGLFLAFGAVLFLVTERRRTLARLNTELEDRVARRTAALSEINEALRAEAEERAQAQVALARAQADLAQAGKLSALGKMSAGISHELNQPLMAIRSFAENAVQFMERGQPQKAADNLARISDMARRMGRIIKNLRAFSMQQSEPVKQVDLAAVLDSSIEMIAGRAAAMEVVVHYDPPPGPVWVRGGEVRLGQVFANLITNALDAMADAPVRRLSIDLSAGDPVRIEVRDTGPGVEAPEKVFDPFYSTKEVGASEGMGLGLSISYGIIQGFGGEIRVRNTDAGACFTVELRPWQQQVAA